MKPVSTGRCRGCGADALHRVLDLGTVPAADYFPPADTPVTAAESAHPLAMDLCAECGLAQLADDDTVTEEPRGAEPQALRDQAADAIERIARAGLLAAGSVREYGSPHGGSWLPLLAERGITATADRADLVLDIFGIMHEPDQHGAFAERAAATDDTGWLLLQYHELAAIVGTGEWNALRHGHFAYYSLPALVRLLGAVGLRAEAMWRFGLYGGTVLLGARHGSGGCSAEVAGQLAAEQHLLDPAVVAGLQRAADDQIKALRGWLQTQRAAGTRVYAYGAASRAVALLARAGLDSDLLCAVADASPAKQGRRMPGTDIAIISPAELVSADPDLIVLTLSDLLPEVSTRLPELAGRWVTMDAVIHRTR